MDTYTPSGGYSPQATQNTALTNTMANMPPMPTTPDQAMAGQNTAANNAAAVQGASMPIMANARTQLQGAAQFPQLNQAAGNMDDTFKMFMQDMALAQKYGQPPQPSDAPTGNGFTPGSGNLMMTPGSLAAGFQGFSNPAAGDKFYKGTENNAVDALSSLLKSALGFNVGSYNKGVSTVQDALNALIGGYQTEAGNYKDLYGELTGSQQFQQSEAEKKREFDITQGLDPGTGTGNTSVMTSNIDEGVNALITAALNPDKSALTTAMAGLATPLIKQKVLAKLQSMGISEGDLINAKTASNKGSLYQTIDRLDQSNPEMYTSFDKIKKVAGNLGTLLNQGGTDSTLNTGKVHMTAPDGKTSGLVDQSEVQDAIAQGWKKD